MKQAHPLLSLLVFAVPLFFTGCKCGGSSSVPPALNDLFAACGPNISVNLGGGVYTPAGSVEPITVPAVRNAISLTKDGDKIKWNGGSGMGRPLDGSTADGLVTEVPNTNPKEYDVVLTGTADGKTLEITGRVKIGPPCSGSGTWKVSAGGAQLGQGNWSF